MEQKDILNSVKISLPFSNLTEDKLVELTAYFEPIQVAVDEILFREKDQCDAMYLIVESDALYAVKQEKGKNIALGELSKGSLIGAFSRLTGRVAPNTVMASKKTTLLKLSIQSFDEFFKKYPVDAALILLKRESFQLLQSADFFSSLPEEKLQQLAMHFEVQYVASGEVLMHEHDRTNYLYMVLSGRFLVAKQQNGVDVTIGEIARGELIGELSLLTGAPHAATVSAIRESIVLKLSAKVVDAFFKEYPENALSIAKTAIIRLTQSKKLVRPPIKVITIAPAARNRTHQKFASTFAKVLAKHGSTLLINQKIVNSFLLPDRANMYFTESGEYREMLSGWFSAQEANYTYLVCEVDYQCSEWTQYCLRESDVILWVVDPYEKPSLNDTENFFINMPSARPKKNMLVFVHSPNTIHPRGAENWSILHPHATCHHIKKDSLADMRRIVRISIGKAIGLVLSGGGATGLLYAGVFKALNELNIPIDWIGGTSVGAAMGAVLATDHKYIPEKYVDLIDFLIKSRKKIFDYTLPLLSLIAGYRFGDKLKYIYQKNVYIENSWINFFCVATNLTHNRPEIISTGLLWKAIRASMSLPSILPPISNEKEELLVDGGVIHNLPILPMRNFLGQGKIIAIDIEHNDEMYGDIPEGALSGFNILKRRLLRRQREHFPTMASVIARSIEIGALREKKRMIKETDCHITIQRGSLGMFDVEKGSGLIEHGYKIIIEHAELLEKLKSK